MNSPRKTEAFALSLDEKRLILAHRKIRDRQQKILVNFTEKMAEDFPRIERAVLRLVKGGAA